MFRTLLVIFSGNTSASVLRLLRNLVISWLIPVEDYGIAATFAVMISLVEMVTGLGSQQQIVQSKRGNDPDFQAGLHGFNILRGVVSAVALFLAAGWIAAFLGIPEVAWAYQVLACVPLINAFRNFDIYRMVRSMKFGPSMIGLVGPNVASLILIWPLALIYGDYRIMLASLIAHSAFGVLTTHWVAERRYRFHFDREIMRSAFQFGWPLIINHAFLFLIFNGEKMIVGRELGMTDLALLAMGFTLTLTPTLLLGRIVQTFFLPQLSAVQNDPARFQEMAIVTLQAVLSACAALLMVMAVAMPAVVQIILSPDFLPLVSTVIWMAILQVVRVMKTGSAVIALARGQTTNEMIANAVRIASLPIAWLAVIQYQNILLVIWISTIGEALAFLVSVIVLRWRVTLNLWPIWRSIGVVVVSVISAGIYAMTITTPTDGRLVVPGLLEAGSLLVLIVAGVIAAPELRLYLRKRQMISHSEEA